MDVGGSLSEAGYMVATLEAAVLFVTHVRRTLLSEIHVCALVQYFISAHCPSYVAPARACPFFLESYYLSLSKTKGVACFMLID